MKATSVNDVILALVASLQAAVSYPVYDGPPSKKPLRGVNQYVAIGVEDLDDQASPTTSALMDQTYSGLGQKAREETLHINCAAYGSASTVTQARALAVAALQDVDTYLGVHPTSETYNALVSAISAIRSHNLPGGAIVHIQFTVSATARLT